jgi:two-component system chemotaxis response regulator CheB
MSKFKAVVIGGSAGSFPLVVKILAALPENYPLPVFLCLHRLKHIRSGFSEVLNIKSNMKVVEPYDKQKIMPGLVYLAPSNYHMFIESSRLISLSTEVMVKYSRPSIDLLFDTASYVFKDKMLGIILSGANTDGAEGIRLTKERDGFTIVQEPTEAGIKTMPEAAIKATTIDKVMPIDEIVDFLLAQ